MLLVEEGGSVFFTDVRYDTQAHEEVQAAKVVISRKGALPSLGEWLGRGASGRGDGRSPSSRSTLRLPKRSDCRRCGPWRFRVWAKPLLKSIH